MAFLVSTTGIVGSPNPIILHDLGAIRIPHPSSNLDLETRAPSKDLFASKDLAFSISEGWIVASNGNGQSIIVGEDGTPSLVAADISVTPSGDLSSSNVQEALEELQSEIVSAGGGGGSDYSAVYPITAPTTIINHMAGKKPSVQVLSSSGVAVSGALITHMSVNQVKVELGLLLPGGTIELN